MRLSEGFGNVAWRAPGVVLAVWVRPCAHQERDEFGHCAVAEGGLPERRVSIGVLDVNVRSRIHEDTGRLHLSLLCGEVERRVSLLVRKVDVFPCAQRGTQGLNLTLRRGAVHRTSALPVESHGWRVTPPTVPAAASPHAQEGVAACPATSGLPGPRRWAEQWAEDGVGQP